MKSRTVTVYRRTNCDQSITYYLRWRTYQKTYTTQRIFKTEPSPTKIRLRVWERIAADERRKKELLLQHDDGGSVGLRKISPKDAASAYLEAIDGRLARSTVDRRHRIIDGFTGHMYQESPPASANGITPARVRDYIYYLRELGLAGATINCYLNDLSAWFNWLVDEHHVAVNPVRAKDRLALPHVRVDIKIEGAAGFWELIDSFKDPYQRAVLGVLGTTGLRVGEASNLVWGDYATDELDVVSAVKYERTKRHTRTLPVTSSTRAFIARLRPITGDGRYIIGVQGGTKRLSTQINRWLKPLKRIPHDFRRWYRTSLEAVGCPSTYADDLLGHRATKIRDAYAGYNIRELRVWTNKFDAWLKDGQP